MLLLLPPAAWFVLSHLTAIVQWLLFHQPCHIHSSKGLWFFFGEMVDGDGQEVNELGMDASRGGPILCFTLLIPMQSKYYVPLQGTSRMKMVFLVKSKKSPSHCKVQP
jgi:hypothetical protein